MYQRSAIKVRGCVPLRDLDGELFSIHLWTWWRDEINGIVNVLTGSQGPWLTHSEQFRWLTWIALDEDQLEQLAEFFERTRQEFGLEQLYFDYHRIMFAIAGA